MDSGKLRQLYGRASLYYDWLDWPQERFRYRALRPGLWRGLKGRILDLGAGTGHNAPYYPADADVVTADLCPEMLALARRRIERLGRRPDIRVTDAVKLDFADGEFDSCVSTFLFCVLPDDMQEKALREIRRVLKPGGEVRILEYVYSANPVRRLWMRALAPVVETLYGARFDRRTAELVPAAGLQLVEREFVYSDIILRLGARRPFGAPDGPPRD